MKSFKQFLTESAKQYTFRIKVAGEITPEDMDKIENVLDKWSLVAASKPKRTPIQEHPMDFPQLTNMEVSMVSVIVDYPATPKEIEIAIHDRTGIPADHIRVYNNDDPHEAEREDDAAKEEEEYKPLLTSAYPKTEKDVPFGDKYNKQFLKDLEKMPKMKVAGPSTPKAKTSNDSPQGTQSPVGSTKTAKPTPKSFAR